MNQLHELKSDFRNFLYVVWQALGLPPPTPVQYDLAYYLQHGPRRKVLEAYRGAGKSWITSAFVVWKLWNNPDLKILVVSASKDRSDSFSTFTKRLLHELPFLEHLHPGRRDRDSSIMFDVGHASPSHSPSVKSVGITGQLTGSRADIIVADDIETPNNSLTQLNRDRLSEAVKEFDSILLPGGTVTYLGTPQTESSLYNLLPDRGYEMRVWTARYPYQGKLENYRGRIAPWIEEMVDNDPSLGNQPVDPERFNEHDLMEREASYGRSGFALQFMLDTSLSDSERYPLKTGDWLSMDLDINIAPVKTVWSASPDLIDDSLPNVGFAGDRWYRPMFLSDEWTEYTGSVMTIDPAGRGGDETGYAVVKMLHGTQFVLACGGLDGGYDEDTLNSLARMAWKYGVNKIIVESNFGDGMFTQLFRPVLYQWHEVSIEEVRHSQQKERRIIDTLEPVLNQHRIVVDRSIVLEDSKTENPNYQLFVQMTRITKDKNSIVHDDRLDALSMAVSYWVEQMNKDTAQSLEEHRDWMMEEELNRFEKQVVGSKRSKNKNALHGR